MKRQGKKILWLLLPMTLWLAASDTPAHEESQEDQRKTASKKESSPPLPDLADIIPLTTKLSGRLVKLDNQVTNLMDVSSIEEQFTEMAESLKEPADQLQQLKDSKDFRFQRLVNLREVIERENDGFEKASKPLIKAIGQLEAWRLEWLEEKKRWKEWHSALLQEGSLIQIESAFTKANSIIDKALNNILPQLEILLNVQEKAGRIQSQIYSLYAELDSLVLAGRYGVLLDKTPPMFSAEYFSQFTSEMWYAVLQGLDGISWPSSRFFDLQGWIILLQGFLALAVIIALVRNRAILKGSKQWRFLAMRPLSSGLFFATMTVLMFYEYGGAPATWELFIAIISGISFARLTGALIEAAWKRHFVYGLMSILIITMIMEIISLPHPLFRLYIVLAALISLIFSLRWVGTIRRSKDLRLFALSFRLLSVLFVIIVIVGIWGKEGLAELLFTSSIDSIAITIVFIMFMYILRGGLEWLFQTSPLKRTTGLYKDTDTLINRLALIIYIAFLGLVVLPTILVNWGVYDNLEGAMKSLLALGFNLGSQRISVGLVITAAAVVYITFLISRFLQKLLTDEVLVRRGVDTGVRLSIARLVHYVIILAGFLVALSTLGFDITKLTIILSALGVGIGFGLQGVVNNFVSGLILLFERPVRVGDTVDVGGNLGTIKRIGLRSTTFQTFDNADVIIPNADLVTNQVTNLTLKDRRVRLIIPVGVAYGSDIPLVMKTLNECAEANKSVAKTPEHQVLFLGFGESSLDFELRVWVTDVDMRLKVKSELHQDVDKKFREEKIEIAFPQRDLHLRSLDESIILRPPERSG